MANSEREDLSEQKEDPRYLSEQILTYIGNKRELLGMILDAVRRVQARLGGRKPVCVDLFAGSGIVSRALKAYASELYVNDWEDYARVVASCYLANRSEVDEKAIKCACEEIHAQALEQPVPGVISSLYAPQDDNDIRPGERVFYTRRNAVYLDTVRALIAKQPVEIQPFLLAPLLYEASVHCNTGGVFKGFYKDHRGVGQFGGEGRNALSRIMGEICLKCPVFSRFEQPYHILQSDAREALHSIPHADLTYLDPPYNQHPYGSNYFMLNLIAQNRVPEHISKVSGIPVDWRRSNYNKRGHAREELFAMVRECASKYILLSYNAEGFVSHDEWMEFLREIGDVECTSTGYRTYRACRNLRTRSLRVDEYLYLIERR